MGDGGSMGGGSSGSTTTSTTTTTGASGENSQSTASDANASSSAGSGNNRSTPKQPVNATIKQFKQQNLGYQKLSSGDKQQLREILTKIPQTDSKKAKISLMNEMGKKINWPNTQGSSKRRKIVRANFDVGTNPTSTPKQPVNATIKQFKQQNLGYSQLSASQKQKLRTNLEKLKQTGVRNPGQISMKQQRVLSNIGKIFEGVPNEGKREKIIKQNFGFGQNLKGRGSSAPNVDFPFDIPSLTGQKLRAIGHEMLTGAASFLKEVYDFAFSTPVPKNSGWYNILGEPTNKPFKPLYHKLLNGTLYPVTNMLLGIAVTLIGLSLAVNPLMSRFRAWNLITKFVTFLLLYGFSWTAITLMHGSVHSITMWIRPSAEAMSQLVTNVGKMSGITIGAYFVGSGGIMAAAAGLATELAMRNVLLKYFFPYIFAPLVFILYVSPWERLKSVASMALWQYVNVLTMVIPMAVFLRAATVVKFTAEETLKGMILLIALYGAAAVMPVIMTWAFAKMKGKAVAGAKSAAAGAASRAGAMKDSVWGSGSSSDSTATGNTSPGDRAEAAVETTSVGSSSGSGVPSSGELSDSALEQTGPEGSETATTTAGQVRALHEEEKSSPNSADAKYEAYFKEQKERSGSHRTTMQEKLAD